jgi:hypothetical protein
MVLEIVRSGGRGSSEDRLPELLLVDRREQPTHPRAVAALLLGDRLGLASAVAAGTA